MNFSQETHTTESIEKSPEVKNGDTVKKVLDLADIAVNWKKVFSLLLQDKYTYYKNHYVPASNEVLFQK